MNNQIAELSFENLQHLDDGLLAAGANRALQEIIDDIIERPADDRPRTVTITISLTPTFHGGELDRAVIAHKATAKVPGREGRECIVQPRKTSRGNQLVFSMNGTDVRQPQFGFEDME